MFGVASRVALLRACPAAARRTGTAKGAGVAAAAPALRPSLRVVMVSCYSVAAGSRPPTTAGGGGGGGERFSSMTASRPGGDEDGDSSEGGVRQAGHGGGGMSGHPLPPRTVPDDILGFSCRTYMAGDSDDRYPNAHGVHPAEFKVELTVPVPELGLSASEEERLIQIVGPRYRENRQVLRLVSDRFPNRIDNKRYLVHLLENILVEARNVEDEAA
ncbi:unnamed protein product [Pylaiella littoralis]